MKEFKKAEDIKVGVVGYGGTFNMGKIHLEEMSNAGMTPVAVAEIDPSRRETAKKDFPGIKAYPSLSRMLDQSHVNLVVILTPHNNHAKLALRCLNASKHVICEKPFAITTTECDAMIAAAKKKSLLLSTYHNRHWDGCIMQALKKIKNGTIGEVVRIEAHMAGWAKPQDWWRSSKSISGGILYDWGVHLLEYSLQIINSDIVEVSGFAKTGFWAAKTSWKNDTNEDEGFAVVRFSNGCWLTLCISNIDSNPKPSVLEITGTKGSYLMGHSGWEIINPKEDGTIIVTKGENPPSQWWRFYKNIAGSLNKKERLVITPEWARRPIHILDLANKSAQKGLTLKTKYK